jgi:hypothetical protein
MDDIKTNPLTDQQDQDNYQEILDKYAASVKPEAEIAPAPENPAPETVSATLVDAETSVDNQNITPSPEINQPDTNPNIVDPPQPPPEPKTKTPEEIKAEVDKILADSPNNHPSSETIAPPPTPSSSKFLKTIFIISLIIFLAVVGLLVYFMFFNKPVSTGPVDNNSVPTDVPEVACELNGVEYRLGESFPSADGCNTCVCQSPDVIACTERACANVTTALINTATTSSVSTLSPEKTVQTFYQDYIKTSPLSYKNSPYLTSSLIKSLDEAKNKTPSSDPVLFANSIPDCGVTTNEATIENNSAAVTVFLCHTDGGKQYLRTNLISENGRWKINKISLPF